MDKKENKTRNTKKQDLYHLKVVKKVCQQQCCKTYNVSIYKGGPDHLVIQTAECSIHYLSHKPTSAL